ncbi:MAG: hypothetical protein PHD47_03080 [Acholeplasmataceae bacterium]|nr:hypothetical protein [Acholeplasmataceae bacterium]
MNNLIDRYVYDVTKKLKEEQRAEIDKELRAHIYDMLNGDESEDNVKKVLTNLGAPSKLASNYKEPRYLIGPELFDDYLSVLKIVIIVFGIIALISGLIQLFKPDDNIFETFIDVLFGSIIGSLFTGFALTTLVFAILEYRNVKLRPEFKVESLPQIPKTPSKKNLRVETIVEIILSIVFGGLFMWILLVNYVDLNFNFDTFQFHYTGALLNKDLMYIFVPLFGVSLVVDNIIRVFKLKQGGYSKVLLSTYTISQILGVLLFTIIFLQPNILVPQYIDALINSSGNQNILDSIMWIFRSIIIVIWIGTSIELVILWYKKLNHQN